MLQLRATKRLLPQLRACVQTGALRCWRGSATLTAPPQLQLGVSHRSSQRARLLHCSPVTRSVASAAAAASSSFAASTPPLPARAHQWLDERASRPDLSWRRRSAVKSNIVLMGPPGCGKTSVGRALAASLGHRFVDVDDDVLEPTWGCSVADRLRALGDDAFVREEGAALMRFAATDSVISLSGSNPLHAQSMEHVAKDAVVVYLDIDPNVILSRCEQMKVDRIVGQSSHSLQSILAFRRSVYENSYDVRVLIAPDETPQQIAERVAEAVQRRRLQQGYVSTRGFSGGVEGESGAHEPLDFLDVVSQGLSPDRGLFVPARLDGLRFSSGELQRLLGLAGSYEELALRVLERFPLGDRLHPSVLRRLLYESYASFNAPDVLPVVPLRPLHPSALDASAADVSAAPFHPRMWLMELWHGPTASFKDLSLQLLPKLLRAALDNQRGSNSGSSPHTQGPGPCVGLLVATSGDTGTAALDGFSRQSRMPVMVLYPHRGVSPVQRAQMQTTAGDVLVLGVEADFDFCQRIVKEIFNDEHIKEEFRSIVPDLLLSSANSMNWGRFLPQVVYSVSSYLRLVAAGELRLGQPLDLVVPTGNFGNILAALYAKLVLGLPLGRIVCASNSNNVLSDFLHTGVYDLRQRRFTPTVSPSIDILVSSNLERFLHLLCAGDAEQQRQVQTLFEQLAAEGHFTVPPALLERLRREVQAGWASEEQCLTTIRDTFQRTGQIIDPHTAVAVHVANALLASESSADSPSARTPVLVASTAHFAKFPGAIAAALGHDLSASSDSDLPSMLSWLSSLSPSVAAAMHPQLAALAQQPQLHDLHCDANMDSVVKHISTFLRTFRDAEKARGN